MNISAQSKHEPELGIKIIRANGKVIDLGKYPRRDASRWERARFWLRMKIVNTRARMRI